MFWLIAVAILVMAALLFAWPLLERGSDWRAIGLAVLLVLPLGGALLYREVGTPTALEAAAHEEAQVDLDTATDNLRSRLSERPEDLEGWLLLGRSLKSLQRFDEALEALQTAQGIAPDDPAVKVELAEAMLYASGQPRFSDEVRTLLESALAQNPNLEKGLWLMGIDAAQRGADQEAIDYWQRLLALVEPGSAVSQSVQEQINLARGRLGMEPVAASPDPLEWPGVDVDINLDAAATEALPTPLPESAVLFVIIRPAGMTAGPPLGVSRVDRPRFPVQVSIDDRNAMMPERKLSEQPGLSFQARLSLSGQVTPQAGDWQSEPFEMTVQPDGPIELTLGSVIE